MPEGKLPDLPGSADQDLRENKYHPFFRKTTREFWDAAEINHTEMKKPEKCDHYFEFVKDGVECTKCHSGFTGNLRIKDGKLVFN